MEARKRNPGAEAGAPKVIAFGGANITGASYRPPSAFATPQPLEPAWMPLGDALQLAVAHLTRHWAVSAPLARTVAELAGLGGRAL